MKRIIALVLALALLAVPLGLASCGGGGSGTDGEPRMPDEVARFDSGSKNESNGVTYTIYQVIVKSDVDWEKLSPGRRQAVIDYAFEAAWHHAGQNDVVNYNILGLSEAANEDGSHTPLFMWNRERQSVIVYAGGQQKEELPAPQRK